MKPKKKTAGSVGVVLHKQQFSESMRSWAEFLAGVDPWKTLELTTDKLIEIWARSDHEWQFFSAATPKASKMPGFEHEHGLVVFNHAGAAAVVREKFNGALPEGFQDGGYVGILATKTRHKGIGKYLLSAAERIISEKSTRVYLFVSEFNKSAVRFYKTMGYEEVARATDVFKPGNIELLMVKNLAA